LLDTGEQTLFARVGIFANGCTLSAIDAIGNAKGELHGETLDIAEATMAPADQEEYRRYLGLIPASLDDTTFADAWQEGKSMPLDRLIEGCLPVGR